MEKDAEERGKIILQIQDLRTRKPANYQATITTLQGRLDAISKPEGLKERDLRAIQETQVKARMAALEKIKKLKAELEPALGRPLLANQDDVDLVNDIVRRGVQDGYAAKFKYYKAALAPFFAPEKAGDTRGFESRSKALDSYMFSVIHGFTVLDLAKTPYLHFPIEVEGQTFNLTVSFDDLIGSMKRLMPHFLNADLNEQYLPLEEKKSDQQKTKFDLLQDWAVADLTMRQVWQGESWSKDWAARSLDAIKTLAPIVSKIEGRQPGDPATLANSLLLSAEVSIYARNPTGNISLKDRVKALEHAADLLFFAEAPRHKGDKAMHKKWDLKNVSSLILFYQNMILAGQDAILYSQFLTEAARWQDNMKLPSGASSTLSETNMALLANWYFEVRDQLTDGEKRQIGTGLMENMAASEANLAARKKAARADFYHRFHYIQPVASSVGGTLHAQADQPGAGVAPVAGAKEQDQAAASRGSRAPPAKGVQAQDKGLKRAHTRAAYRKPQAAPQDQKPSTLDAALSRVPRFAEAAGGFVAFVGIPFGLRKKNRSGIAPLLMLLGAGVALFAPKPASALGLGGSSTGGLSGQANTSGGGIVINPGHVPPGTPAPGTGTGSSGPTSVSLSTNDDPFIAKLLAYLQNPPQDPKLNPHPGLPPGTYIKYFNYLFQKVNVNWIQNVNVNGIVLPYQGPITGTATGTDWDEGAQMVVAFESLVYGNDVNGVPFGWGFEADGKTPNAQLMTLLNGFELFYKLLDPVADPGYLLLNELNQVTGINLSASMTSGPTQAQATQFFGFLFPKVLDPVTGERNPIPFNESDFFLQLPISAAIINDIWNKYVDPANPQNSILGTIFGPPFNKKFDPTNQQHTDLLASLTNMVGPTRSGLDANGNPDDGKYPAYLLTSNLQLDTSQRLSRMASVSDPTQTNLLANLLSERDVINNIWNGSATIGLIFGADFLSYHNDGTTMLGKRSQAMAAMIASWIGTGTYPGKTLDKFLALQNITPKQFPDWQSLKAVLDDQAEAVRQKSSWIEVFGIKDYVATDERNRAMLGLIASQVKRKGGPTTGLQLIARPDLSDADLVEGPLVFDNIKDVLTDLANQSTLIDNFSKWSSIFGFTGNYDALNPVHRAIVSELASQIILGPRTTGTVITVNDDLTAIIETPNQPLIWKIRR